MGLTGEPDGPPARVGPSMVDFMTGATGATGLLACILRAQPDRQRLRRRYLPVRRRDAPAQLFGGVVPERAATVAPPAAQRASSRSRRSRPSRPRMAGSSSCA